MRPNTGRYTKGAKQVINIPQPLPARGETMNAATAVTVNVIATPLVCETNSAINVCVQTLDGILRMLNKLSISLSLYQLKGRDDERFS